MTEPFHFHLFEFVRAVNEVTRRDLVAEGFADLCDTKRHAYAHAVDNVFIAEEDALRRFGTQICLVRFITNGTRICIKHQVELPRLGERAFLVGVGADHFAVVCRCDGEEWQNLELGQVIGAGQFLEFLTSCFIFKRFFVESENLVVTFVDHRDQVVLAVTQLGQFAVNHRVIEARDVA